MDNAFDTEIARRLQDVKRTPDVGVNVRIGRVIRIWNGDQRSQVQHNLAVAHCGANAVGITNIAGKYVDRPLDVLVRFVQPTPRVETVVKDESAYLGAERHKIFGQMRADEA